MRRLLLVTAFLAFSLTACGSASTPIAAPLATPAVPVVAVVPPVGDACLVGTWHLDNETDTSLIASGTLTLTGLAGSIMTIHADGTGSLDYTNSAPLTGDYSGSTLVETYRGLNTFTMLVSPDPTLKGHLIITMLTRTATETATLSGAKLGTHVAPVPASFLPSTLAHQPVSASLAPPPAPPSPVFPNSFLSSPPFLFAPKSPLSFASPPAIMPLCRSTLTSRQPAYRAT